MGKIDFLMSCIDITTEDHRFPRGSQFLASFEKGVVESQLEGHAAMIATTVGEITVQQNEGRVVGDDRASFAANSYAGKWRFASVYD